MTGRRMGYTGPESPRGAGKQQSWAPCQGEVCQSKPALSHWPRGHWVVRKAGPGRAAGTQLPALGLQARVRLTQRCCLAQGAGPLLAFGRRLLEPGTGRIPKGRLQSWEPAWLDTNPELLPPLCSLMSPPRDLRRPQPCWFLWGHGHAQNWSLHIPLSYQVSCASRGSLGVKEMEGDCMVQPQATSLEYVTAPPSKLASHPAGAE